jgi:hypothetical protein
VSEEAALKVVMTQAVPAVGELVIVSIEYPVDGQ